VTGYASDADVAHSLRSGFDAHLSKPIEVDELLRTMARLVGRGGISNVATA
jgi:CheY-like chemotaxis protein